MNKKKIIAIVLLIALALFAMFAISNEEKEPVNNVIEGESVEDKNDDKENIIVEQDEEDDLTSEEEESTETATKKTDKETEGEFNEGSNTVVESKPAPTIIFTDINNSIEDGWSNDKNTIINVNVVDNSNKGIKEMYYCKISSEDIENKALSCDPKTQFINISEDITFDTEAFNHAVCVKAVDNAGKSTTKCSSATLNFGIDTSKPEIEIAKPIDTILQKSVENYDELFGVKAADIGYSGLKSLTYSEEVNQDVADTYTITYTAVDNAGNMTTESKTVIVVSNEIAYTISDNVSDANEWINHSVEIVITSLESDASAKHCVRIGNCTPTIDIEVNRGVELSVDSEFATACFAFIKSGIVIKTECRVYKIDQRKPSITDNKTGTINVSVYDSVNLMEGIVAFDDLSEVATFVPTGNKVIEENGVYYLDVTELGIHEVTYTATDNAGNIETHKRTYYVDAPNPTLSLSTNAKVNSMGWAKNNINVSINTDTKDYTIKTCVTTETSCTPTENKGLVINEESASIKMCVVIVSKYGKESTRVCTDSYKLDKTVPEYGKIVYFGSIGKRPVTIPASCPAGYQESSTAEEISQGECRSINPTGVEYEVLIYSYTNKTPESVQEESTGWYVSDVRIDVIEERDALSGHIGTTTNHGKNVVTVDGANIMVRAYINDKAYNTLTITEYINIDTVAPIPTLEVEGTLGADGWYVSSNTPDRLYFKPSGTDATSGISSSVVLEKPEAVYVDGDRYYIETAAAGTYDLKVKTVDVAGNSSESILTLKYDSTK